MKYSENSLKIYEKLYLNKKLNETKPEDVHRRVAYFVANTSEEEQQFYEMMQSKAFRPGTPTLINAGTTSTNPLDKQLMSCFIYKLEDSMDSIIDMWGTLSKIYASGAGAGINITNLREKGSPISSSGQASGSLAYLNVLEIVSQTVMAGGKNRRAANLAVFRHDHPDTLEILDSKKDKKSLRSFNISMLAPNNLMEIVCNNVPKEDIKYESPNPISKIYTDPISPTFLDPYHLWNKVVENAWETGDPGLLFIDTANKFNPLPSKGIINCANACITGDTLLFDGNKLTQVKDPGSIFTSWQTGIKNIIELELSNGKSIKLTPDHIIQDSNGNDIQAINSLGKQINILMEQRYYTGEIIHDPIIVLLGFLYGDCSICGKNYGICVNISKKREPHIVKMLIKYGFHKQESGDYYISGKDIDETILDYAELLFQTSAYKIIPTYVMTKDVNFIASFLKGVFSANGSMLMGKGKRITFKTISKKLAKQLQILLSLFGISAYITTSKEQKIKWKNGTYTSKKGYNLDIANLDSLEKFQKYIGFIEGYKKAKLYTVIDNKNKGRTIFPTVKTINQLKPKIVYDFNMKDNIPYNSANGIIIHNCQEIPLPDWSACTLGAINLNTCLKQVDINKLGFNWEELKRLTKLGVRFLDNVIDKTSYLHPKFEEEMKATRPIGLGLMGLADVFVKLEIPYNSDEAIELFRKICKCLTKTAIRKSIKLAKEKGAIEIPIPKVDYIHFENLLRYYGCNSDDIRRFNEYGIRNCTWTTCQPTGTTALSADCSYSFEPLSAIVWQKQLAESNELMTFVNPEFERYIEQEYFKNFHDIQVKQNQEYVKKELIEKIIKNNGSVKGIKEIPKNIQEIFVTAHDINPLDKLSMQAAGQRYISLGISSTCNLPNSATKKDVEKIFIKAWELGLKGITVYRDGCLENQPIHFGEKKKIKIPIIDDGGIGTLTVTKEELEEYKRIIEQKKTKHPLFSSEDYKEMLKPFPKKRPITRDGKTFEIETPHGRLYLTLNKDDNNKPLEVFLRLGKSGKLENLLLDTLGRLVSKNLQSEVPFNEISSLLRGTREDKFWFRLFEDQEEPFAAESIIDAIGIIMDSYYNDVEKTSDESLKEKAPHELVSNVSFYSECPICGMFSVLHNTGCRGGQCTSPNCFYSACG